jgi:hypothetical protein
LLERGQGEGHREAAFARKRPKAKDIEKQLLQEMGQGEGHREAAFARKGPRRRT